MNELLATAIQAHGGIDRWRATERIEVDLDVGGFALASKGRGRALRGYVGRVETGRVRAELEPFAGGVGIIEGEAVRIERAGERVAERADPRPLFRRPRRLLRWDSLDLLYFGGYALWNYVNTPWLLAGEGFECSEGEPWIEAGESWRRLDVSFPANVPTHSREQSFYVDERGLVRRHDYTAEVFGSWARAVHLWQEHQEFDGLIFPTRRRVYPRRPDGRRRGFPTLVWIDAAAYRLR